MSPIFILLLLTLVGYANSTAPSGVSTVQPGEPSIAHTRLSEASGDCPGAQSIANARSLAPGTEVSVQGTVTVPTGVLTPDRSFAVQDATGGIYVYGKGVA